MTRTLTSNQHAFTLIELMIAVSLGMLIIYTATAAFRVAAQSVTTANRLSLENSIMRAGFQLAHRDLDFWTNVDDPDTTTRQGLRPGTAGNGMPFTAFSTSWVGSGGDTEAATAHDPRDTAWAMGNPRVWWRGNMAEKGHLDGGNPGTDLRFGRYSLFANRVTTLEGGHLAPVNITTGGTPAKPITSSVGYASATTSLTVPHSWAYGQISGLVKALGFYGLCDYLPANAIYAYYEPYGSGSNLGGMPKWMIEPRGDFNNGDGNQQTPRGKYRNSYQTSYGLIDPRSTKDLSTLQKRLRQRYHLGYGSGEGSQNDFNLISAIPDDLLVQRPPNWPGLSISVQRFIKNTRFVNMARVSWTNAITGQSAELSFSGFGTTLRGARQQRNASGGWAKWDNDGTTTNDITLDGH